MDLLQSAKPIALSFLEKAYQGNGFFSYTLGHDLYDTRVKWGLANAVFAVKLYHIVKSLDQLDTRKKAEVVSFIKSFQNSHGAYSDPLVYSKSRWINKLACLKNGNFSNFLGHKTVIAETRQAIVAFLLLDEKPDKPFTQLPYTLKAVDRFFGRLHWKNTWAAASHLNHLVFFYKMNKDLFGFKAEESARLLEHCFGVIDSLQNKADGFWYKGAASRRNKVNAAMKILSAFAIAGRKEIPCARKLIDAVVDNTDEYYYDGCDHLNTMFVLKYASESAGSAYRPDDIKQFCEARLKRYERYCFPEGFGFLPVSAPRRYYRVTLSKNFLGPDIHGTFMFIWAVSLAAQLLNQGQNEYQPIIN